MNVMQGERALSGYLHVRGLAYTPAHAARGEVIDRFEFGERYLVKMAVGKSYDIPDLEDILVIMQAEFLGNCVPVVELINTTRRGGYGPMSVEGTTVLELMEWVVGVIFVIVMIAFLFGAFD